MRAAVLTGLVVVAIGLLVFILYVLPPRRRPIRDIPLKSHFHGLLLFGKDGSFVAVTNPGLGDDLRFRKMVRPDGSWSLRFSVYARDLAPDFGERLRTAWRGAHDASSLTVDEGKDSLGQCDGSIGGDLLGDPASLEGVVRLFVRVLGRSESTCYRVEFLGPKDFEAADRYFGFGKDGRS